MKPTVRIQPSWERTYVRRPPAGSPTPADEQVDDKVSVLSEENHQQGVQVQPLDQQPEEVGHDEVLEKHQTGFTPHLEHTHTSPESFTHR